MTVSGHSIGSRGCGRRSTHRPVDRLTARPRTGFPASDLVDVLVVARVIVMVCGRGTSSGRGGRKDGICCVCVRGGEIKRCSRDENGLCVCVCVVLTDVHGISEWRDIGRSVSIECVGYGRNYVFLRIMCVCRAWWRRGRGRGRSDAVGRTIGRPVDGRRVSHVVTRARRGVRWRARARSKTLVRSFFWPIARLPVDRWFANDRRRFGRR